MPANILLTATPTVSTSPAYSSGDSIGGKMTLTDAGIQGPCTLLLQAVTIIDLGKQNANIDVILFSSDPSGTTFTDNGALTVADADVVKIIGAIPVTTWSSFADNSVGQARVLSVPVSVSAGSLYGCLVSRGTPTYASASDIKVILQFEA